MFNNNAEHRNKNNPFATGGINAENWGKALFVPKVPKKSIPERHPNPATPWKKFKSELVEKQREDSSDAINMNSSEAQETLKKREQNYRRTMITERSKQPTKWESFETDKPESSSFSKNKLRKSKEDLEKTEELTKVNHQFDNVDLKNFDSRKLDFKLNNNMRKLLTKSILVTKDSFRANVKAIQKRKRRKMEHK